MERLTWKIRISVLWLFMAVAMSAHSVLSFMERDVVEQMWEMQMGVGMLVFTALLAGSLDHGRTVPDSKGLCKPLGEYRSGDCLYAAQHRAPN